MTFILGAQSLSKLSGVHPDLIRVVRRAIKLTEIDFRVTEGLRTLARQKELKAAGASQTLNSRHITGHAVDVVALLGKEVRWDFALYPKIAAALRDAGKEFDIVIRWGACWQEINDIRNLNAAVTEYVAAQKRKGKRPFIDAAHFELPARAYP